MGEATMRKHEREQEIYLCYALVRRNNTVIRMIMLPHTVTPMNK